MHSWSTVSSPVGFRIQRHADHHAHSFRPYQILRRIDNAPTLPFEYIPMIFLALCPPIFKTLMDPRVDAINDFVRGKPNKNQWNNAQEPSESDKKALNIAYGYFAIIFFVFTYLTFYFA